MVALIFPLAFFAIIALVIFSAKKTAAGRERLLEQLRAGLAAGAHPVRIEYYPGGRNSPSRLTLSVDVARDGSFTVQKEGAADRLLEGMGLEGKILSNDPDFDSRFHVVADDEGFAAAYFGSAKKQEAVKALFGQGCARVELDGGALRVVWMALCLKEGMNTDFVRNSMPAMAVLAEDFPAAGASAAPFGPVSGGMTKQVFDRLFAIGLAFGFCAILVVPVLADAMNIRPLSSMEVLWASLRCSGPVLAGFILCVAAWLKGCTWFGSGMLEGTVIGLLIVPFGGYWTFLGVNCLADRASAVLHTALVVRPIVTHSKNSTTCRVLVQSWRPGHSTEQIAASVDVCGALRPHRSRAVIATKPGALGHPWVLDVNYENPP
jgi:hypothetical protein